MRIRKSVFIDRPPADVFSFVADPSNDIRWRTYLLASSALGGLPLQVGSRVRQSYSYEGRAASIELEVTALETDERIDFRTSGQYRGSASYTFRPEDDGTRFGFAISANVTGAAALMSGYIEKTAGSYLEGDLKRLKHALESGEA
ncbi:MAG: hypothetical protein Kow0067_13180 [Coriobacteriia bacterium]